MPGMDWYEAEIFNLESNPLHWWKETEKLFPTLPDLSSKLKILVVLEIFLLKSEVDYFLITLIGL